MKQVGADPDLGTGHREYYVRDAEGNIMATYRYTNTTSASFRVMERPIYGSSRLGSYDRPRQLLGAQNIPAVATMSHAAKRYELTDHLGNVNTVVTGRLLPGNGAGSDYQAEVISATLHEPFGLNLTGMTWQSDVARFGFQGQIKELEMNAIHFKYREYSLDGGGFWSVDPLAAKYPWNSPYAFSENRVIDGVDLEGREYAESYLQELSKEATTNPASFVLFKPELRVETAIALFRERASENHGFISIPASLQNSTIVPDYSDNRIFYGRYDTFDDEIILAIAATNNGIEDAVSILFHETMHKDALDKKLLPYESNILTGIIFQQEGPSGLMFDVPEFMPPSNHSLNELRSYSSELGFDKLGFAKLSDERKKKIDGNLNEYDSDYKQALKIESENGLDGSGDSKE
ncbi:MAG: hypothetical protein RBT71_05965 [Flavobacteriales bacterium]|jgi:RHS repeat-associated protein|nr:hypothetical protein [Flavobacteriales bacterium]